RKSALVQFQLRTHDDNRAARVVHAFSKQVLAKATLFALQRVGQRLQRTVVGATQYASAATVVEQCVYSFLQHTLLISDDDIGRVEFNHLLESIVAVDDAAIQIVQI